MVNSLAMNVDWETGLHATPGWAFENALYVDYMPEKFFLAIECGMVPIVYGMADYASIAPPKSFIDVMYFESMEALAAFLKYLDENPAEYFESILNGGRNLKLNTRRGWAVGCVRNCGRIQI
jgi:Glycosyltransferase family 10 (fucosyltransferase) C-term